VIYLLIAVGFPPSGSGGKIVHILGKTIQKHDTQSRRETVQNKEAS
jgi:hypothetical protein